MATENKFLNYSGFFLKSVISASIIMFASMALGELIYDENLFSGFLKRPSIWIGILFETSIATLLITILGTLILYRFRYSNRKKFIQISATTWCSLSAVLVALYAYFYWPREWHLTAMAPGLIFGWVLPGLFTLIFFTLFSLNLRQATQE